MTGERHLCNESTIEALSYSKIQIKKLNEVESGCGYTLQGLALPLTKPCIMTKDFHVNEQCHIISTEERALLQVDSERFDLT
jgi:hypothetical protein